MTTHNDILIVDDTLDWREVIAELCSFADSSLFTYGSYLETLSEVEKRTTPFALAIIDIRLDETDASNKEGLQLAMALKAICSNTSIIVITGHPTIDTVIESFREIEVFDYVRKRNFNHKKFQSVVHRALEKFHVKQATPTTEELAVQIAHSEREAILTPLSMDLIHRMSNTVERIPKRITLAKQLLKKESINNSEIVAILDHISNDVSDAVAEAHQAVDTAIANDENIQVESLVDSIVDELEFIAPANVEIVYDSRSSLSFVKANWYQLKNAILNIVDNSIRAIEGYGRIVIALDKGRSDSDYVEIKVSDTGAGIPEDKLDSVFELGFSSRKEGFGYGLWRSKSIIMAIGGSITVHSTLKVGSIFSIKLPLSAS